MRGDAGQEQEGGLKEEIETVMRKTKLRKGKEGRECLGREIMERGKERKKAIFRKRKLEDKRGQKMASISGWLMTN